MEIPNELKPDLHKALLGPLSIAEEIYGALLPGCTSSSCSLARRIRR